MKRRTGLFCAAAVACALCLAMVTTCVGSDSTAEPDAHVQLDVGPLPDVWVEPDSAPPLARGDIQIQLLTTQGDPVENAVVVVNDMPHGNTNADGLFCAQDIPAVEALVRLTSDSCSKVEESIIVMANAIVTLKLTCLPVMSIVLPNAIAGGTISGPDGFELVIPPDSLSMYGDPVSGSVDVRYGILNRPEDMRAAPGMIAEGSDDSLFELESFGMVEVTFTKFGEPVDFDGQASLTLPLNPMAPFAHGDTVALWSFNEQTGHWQQEGLGTVDTQTTGAPLFVATVTHFSWWNCDEPLSDKNCITGRLLDGNGDPAANTTVELVGEDYLYSARVQTVADGRFCVDVKRASLNHLTARFIDDSHFLSWDASQIQAGSTATVCAMGGCTDLGDLTMTPTPGLAVCP